MTDPPDATPADDTTAATSALLHLLRGCDDADERAELARRVETCGLGWRLDPAVANAAAEAWFATSVVVGTAGACERIADRIAELQRAHPGIAPITMRVAEVLVNASAGAASAADAERLADRVELLLAASPLDARLAELAATARANATGADCEPGRRAAIADRIASLLDRFPDRAGIALQLARALFHCVLDRSAVARARGLERLQQLAQRFRADAAVALRSVRAVIAAAARGDELAVASARSTADDACRRFPADAALAVARLEALRTVPGATVGEDESIVVAAVDAFAGVSAVAAAAAHTLAQMIRRWPARATVLAARLERLGSIDAPPEVAAAVVEGLGAAAAIAPEFAGAHRWLRRLDELAAMHATSRVVAEATARALVHRAFALPGTAAAVDLRERLEDLAQRWPDSSALATALAQLLFRAARATEALVQRRTAAEQISELARRRPTSSVLQQLQVAALVAWLEVEPERTGRQAAVALIRSPEHIAPGLRAALEQAAELDDTGARRRALSAATGPVDPR